MPTDTAIPLDDRAIAAQGSGDPDDLLNTADLSEWLGVSTAWLEIGRFRGYGPPYIRLGHKGPNSPVRYHRGTVIQWLHERMHRSTAEYSARRAPSSR